MATVSIKNVGPVEQFSFQVPPDGGVVVFKARNGRGKSHTLNAIDSLAGGKGKVPLRDLARSGEVEGFGAKLGEPNYYDDGSPRLIAELEITRHRDDSTKRWKRTEDADEIEAIARLICAAPDHAIVAALMTAELLQWEPFDPGSKKGELRFNGLRYSTELDEFGVPALDAHLRRIFLEQLEPPRPQVSKAQ